jgi:hypothetical protein
MKTKEARSTSPPVAPAEVLSVLRFSSLLNCNFFILIHRSFCTIFSCNLIEIFYLFTILLVVRVI